MFRRATFLRRRRKVYSKLTQEEDTCLAVEAIKGHVWDDRVRLWAFGP